ncbi:MAG: DUF1015 domain-containing protein [Burkholderiales bacterium]|nr:MAG: DUF1015 domain-containing protein [Burkholderiales bacterium]
MPLIRPFPGLRPAPGRAADVAAPPYDVLSTTEARQRALGKPWSFLHISKPEIDLPEGTNPYAPEVYAKAVENMQRMVVEGVLRQDERHCYYAYRLSMPIAGKQHVQTGLVAAAAVKDYDSNRIRKHEFTRPDKEDDRVRQIEALGAQTGPVLLAYPQTPAADALLAQATAGAPTDDLLADDGIRHQIWVIDEAALVEAISRTFDAMPALYIADGHHRSAAASRVAAHHHRPGGLQQSDYFLAVIFPQQEMRILDYNRVVRDLNGLTREGFLSRLKPAFQVEASATPVKPARPGEVGMYLPGQWYRLTIDPARIPDDPVKRLDVSLLADHLLEPVLGIHDLRRDHRIDFVGGIRGLEELERRVDRGEMAVAFAMFATRMDELMAVADAGEVMPPKSTWFEPKLADGLVSHLIG